MLKSLQGKTLHLIQSVSPDSAGLKRGWSRGSATSHALQLCPPVTSTTGCRWRREPSFYREKSRNLGLPWCGPVVRSPPCARVPGLSLVQEDPTCHGVTRTCVPLLKPAHAEPGAPQQSSHCNEKPPHYSWKVALTCHSWRGSSVAAETQCSQK